jgi:hypothetical protein
VTVVVNDGDGGEDTGSVNVEVDNVAPTATLGNGGDVDEGSAGTVTFTDQADASTADELAGFTYSYDFDDDGTFEIVGSTDASVTVPSTFLADGPSSRTVSARIFDKDGGFTDYSTDITVLNVEPTVSAGADDTIDEGSTFTGCGSFTDPGADTWTATVDYGDGSGPQPLTLSGKTFSLSHTYADGPASWTITVTVTDDEGDAGVDTVGILVSNVAPTIALGGAATTNEGATYSLTLGAVTDPGIDTVTSYIVHWGDGATSTYLDDGVKTHVYADGPNPYTITVDLVDEDGTHLAAGSKSIMVLNVAPVVTLSGDFSDVPEGATRTYTYTATDAGNDPLAITESCGAMATLVLTPAVNSFDCTFPDGPASTEIKVTANDGDPTNNIGTDARTVSITNVAPSVPTVTITFDPFTHLAIATATYTDPGQDTHTATFDWGAFGVTTDKPASGGVVADSRVLPNGCYTLTVTVTVKDSDGATGAKSATLIGSADAYVTAFEAPIKDNERNIAKYGNVVPIKVRITSSCSGAAITSPTLFITIAEGNVADVLPDTTPVIVAESVSNADTGAQMRVNGSGYMYNFSTKVLTQGKDYTIRIRVGSITGPIIARALFQPKK